MHDFNAATEGSGPATRLTSDGKGNYLGATWREESVGAGCLYAVTLPATSSASIASVRGPVAREEPPPRDLRLTILAELASPSKQYEDSVENNRTLNNPFVSTNLLGGYDYKGGVDIYDPPPGSEPLKATRAAEAGTQPIPLYSFTGGDDGASPHGALVIGNDGNYYGTTAYFGAGGYGTVFRLTPEGVLTTLHAFAGTGDGAQPMAGLVLASDGNFYGTTNYNSYDPTNGRMGNGTIFRVTPDGQFTTLHTFASDRTEGLAPAAALLQASDGKLYGVTSAGGSLGSNGVVFAITTDGIFTKVGDLSNPLLLSNDGENSVYGSAPIAALIQGSDGNLYGTTSQGGTENSGVVFRVDLNLHPAFFTGETALSNGVYYLQFPTGNPFGYYSYLADPHFIYHFDMGYEYCFDAADGRKGIYLYDFKSSTFFYTSPTFPFPYLYDFTLNTVLYYYPDPNNAGHYNTDGYRFFYRFDTGQIITK